ncbi:hypothetical protein HYH43_13915 [Clostridium botulinum]|uniref:hypothetical protein n=1 Tax=Clostridium botulinum TaxID=1491 RepID=UPI001C9B1D1A|nr:hypothetical protein [Clostridium botulinum]MBY6790530.1 hypothetical protein [Clostridium botulinum]NFG76254.1 hypothetical protein [Clostridium botulinum]
MLEKDSIYSLINEMFEDRIKELTSEEREIEIMKFREGLAPDRPSFVVNQEDVIEKLKNSFKNLYSKSLNMESWMLVSDYGNGKSHILNTIKSNLRVIKNNIVISIYAKAQSPFYPIQEILRHINREIIRKSICRNVLKIQGNNSDKDIQINNIMTELQKSKELSKLLWYVSNGSIEEKIKSLDVLTQQDISKQILKDLDINEKNILKEIGEFFYILMEYLKKENFYIIVLIEEFENVFKWRKKEKSIFYEQLKEMMNNSTSLGNMFFMLVATNIFNDEIEEKRNKAYEINGIDPAVYDRLKAKSLKLKSIQKDEEAIKLIKKIKERYEIFYKCSIDENEVMEELPARLKNINYRSYIQTITLIMDDIINGKVVKSHNNKLDFNNKVQMLEQKEKNISNERNSIKEEIDSNTNKETSLALKKKFISAISRILEINNYKVKEIKIKAGYIIAKPKNKRNYRLFYVTYSTNINSSFIFKKLQSCESIAINEGCDKNNIYFIYCKSSVSEKINEKIQKYNPAVIKTVSLEDDDLTRILLLVKENIDNNEKENIAIEYSKYMNLELGDKNE